MNVEDLRDLIDDLPLDAEVVFAHQPHYPFSLQISGDTVYDEDNNTFYLSEGEQIGYLKGDVSKELGWR